MCLKLLTLIAAALSPMASALRYAGFSSSISCSGPSFFCEDDGAVCCAMPAGFGFSAQFLDFPDGSQGQGYTGDTCSAFLFAVFGPGDKCWNGGGNQFTHLNWFHNGRRRSIDERSKNQTCADVSGFSYTDHTGAEKTIKVAKDEAAAVADLYHKQDFPALAKYPDY